MFRYFLTFLAIGIHLAVPLGLPVPHFHGTECHVHWGGGYHHDESAHRETGHGSPWTGSVEHGHPHAHGASGGHYHASEVSPWLQQTEFPTHDSGSEGPDESRPEQSTCVYCSLTDSPIVAAALFEISLDSALHLCLGIVETESASLAPPSAQPIRGPPGSNVH